MASPVLLAVLGLVLWLPRVLEDESVELPRYPLLAGREIVAELLATEENSDLLKRSFVIVGTVRERDTEAGSFVIEQPAMACCASYSIRFRVLGSPPEGERDPAARVAVFGRLCPLPRAKDPAPPRGRRPVFSATVEDWAINAERVVAAERVLYRNNAIDLLDAPSTSLFRRAVRESGLEPELRELAPITILAPMDHAFRRLGAQELASLFDPQDRAALRDLVLSHIVNGQRGRRQFVGEGAIGNLKHERIPARIGPGGQRLVGGSRFAFADMTASNGVVHLMTDFLRPEGPVRAPHHSKGGEDAP